MDEAYAEFSGFSAIPWIRKYPQLFVARTFRKSPASQPFVWRGDRMQRIARPGPPCHAAVPVNLQRW